MKKVYSILKYFKSLFLRFGNVMKNVGNLVLLIPVYFLGVGSSSILARIMGRNFLVLKSDDDAQSLWNECDIGGGAREEYYRQF